MAYSDYAHEMARMIQTERMKLWLLSWVLKREAPRLDLAVIEEAGTPVNEMVKIMA